MRFITAPSSLFAIALLACGGASTPSSSPEATDAGPAPDGAAASSGEPYQFVVPCHDLQLQGPGVKTIPRTGHLPPAEGGTVVDGTYVLTAVNRYRAADDGRVEMDAPQRFTLAVRGNVIEQTSESEHSVVQRTRLAFTTTGATLEPKLTCGVFLIAPIVQTSYTATPTSLTLLEVPASMSFVFTRQQ